MKQDEIDAIGKRLRIARKSMDLTQADVASKLDCSVKHYGCLERGLICISIELMLKFRALTGIELEYLLTGEITNNTDFSFITKYNSLSPAERQKAEAMMDLLFDFKNLVSGKEQ